MTGQKNCLKELKEEKYSLGSCNYLALKFTLSLFNMLV